MQKFDQSKNEARKTYHAPHIRTYTAAQLLDLIGPVQAGSMDTSEDNLLGMNFSGGTGYYAPEEDSGTRAG